MKKIAVVLIRKSSKGLLDKNIKLFCGKPLCFYTIDVAIDSKKFVNMSMEKNANT